MGWIRSRIRSWLELPGRCPDMPAVGNVRIDGSWPRASGLRLRSAGGGSAGSGIKELIALPDIFRKILGGSVDLIIYGDLKLVIDDGIRPDGAMPARRRNTGVCPRARRTSST